MALAVYAPDRTGGKFARRRRKGIILDILLTEPDRTMSSAMAKMWKNKGVSAALQGLPDHDEVFFRSLTGRGVVFASSLSNFVPAANLLDTSAVPYRIVGTGAVAPENGLQAIPAAFGPCLFVGTTQAG